MPRKLCIFMVLKIGLVVAINVVFLNYAVINFLNYDIQTAVTLIESCPTILLWRVWSFSSNFKRKVQNMGIIFRHLIAQTEKNLGNIINSCTLKKLHHITESRFSVLVDIITLHVI